MTLAGPPDTAEITPLLVPCLRRQPVAAAWLYGSVARGEGRRTSDVDLGVLFARHQESDRRRVLREIEHAAGRIFPGRALSVVDLERAPLLLQHRVLRDGILLVDSDSAACSRFTARVLEAFCASRAVRSTFDSATRYRLAHAVTSRGAG